MAVKCLSWPDLTSVISFPSWHIGSNKSDNISEHARLWKAERTRTSNTVSSRSWKADLFLLHYYKRYHIFCKMLKAVGDLYLAHLISLSQLHFS